MSFARKPYPGLTPTQMLFLSSSESEEDGILRNSSDSDDDEAGETKHSLFFSSGRIPTSKTSLSFDEKKSPLLSSRALLLSSSESEEESFDNDSDPDDEIALDPIKVGKDKFFFGDALGRGAYGIVRKAYKNNNKTTAVAVKIIDFSDDESVTFEKCENEKNIMHTLTHLQAPHVVRLDGFAVRGYDYFIIMECMEYSLEDYFIYENKALEWSLRMQILRNITEAVAFLHSHNIVHRDIKDGNILFDANGNAKLGDFGAAKVMDNKIGWIGSPAWVAPEIGVEIYTDKADVFSLAILLRQLAEWKIPYDEVADRNEIVIMKMQGKREAISDACPKKIADLITWGWQQKPRLRPTAQEFLEELKRIKCY